MVKVKRKKGFNNYLIENYSDMFQLLRKLFWGGYILSLSFSVVSVVIIIALGLIAILWIYGKQTLMNPLLLVVLSFISLSITFPIAKSVLEHMADKLS